MTLQMYQQQIRQMLHNHWRMKRLSIITIERNYKPALEILLNTLPAYYDELTTDDLVAYCLTIESYNKRDLQITMIRYVYRLVHNIQLQWDIFPYAVRKKKIQPRFSPQEVQQILNSISNPIHKLIILTQYAAGLRVGEVVFLKKRDLYREPGCLFIDGEGINNDRLNPIPAHVLDALKRISQDKKADQFIFPGQFGGHLSVGTVQTILRAAKKKAGINNTASTHGLRRGYSTEVLQKTGNLIAVRDLLGHADVRTTQIYTGLDISFLKTLFNPAEEIKVA
jgi:integrase